MLRRQVTFESSQQVTFEIDFHFHLTRLLNQEQYQQVMKLSQHLTLAYNHRYKISIQRRRFNLPNSQNSWKNRISKNDKDADRIIAFTTLDLLFLFFFFLFILL